MELPDSCAVAVSANFQLSATQSRCKGYRQHTSNVEMYKHLTGQPHCGSPEVVFTNVLPVPDSVMVALVFTPDTYVFPVPLLLTSTLAKLPITVTEPVLQSKQRSREVAQLLAMLMKSVMTGELQMHDVASKGFTKNA